MPKALITGAAGFIGLHLSRALLERGYQLKLVDNFARGVADAEWSAVREHPAVSVLECDLLAPGSLDGAGEDFDFIVHLAALLGVQNVRNRPYEVLTLNHAMLERVIGLARRQRRLARLLFSSTSEVYGGTLRYFGMPVPTPETTPLAVNDLAEPRTSYMLSKIYGEALCRHSGAPFTIIRVHNAYGPRMGLAHVIPELLGKAHRLAPGAPLEVFSAGHRRAFCYISDVVELIARMLEAPACQGEVLNVGNETAEISMGDLGRVVLETVGRKAEILALPDTPGSPERRVPAMEKTASLTGYRACVGLAEGVRRTYEWYRDRVFAGGQPSAI
jgi:nucleoside-diphosphate-sugar epimerase